MKLLRYFTFILHRALSSNVGLTRPHVFLHTRHISNAQSLGSRALGGGGGESKVVGEEKVKDQRGQGLEGFLCGSESTEPPAERTGDGAGGMAHRGRGLTGTLCLLPAMQVFLRFSKHLPGACLMRVNLVGIMGLGKISEPE